MKMAVFSGKEYAREFRRMETTGATSFFLRSLASNDWGDGGFIAVGAFVNDQLDE